MYLVRAKSQIQSHCTKNKPIGINRTGMMHRLLYDMMHIRSPNPGDFCHLLNCCFFKVQLSG